MKDNTKTKKDPSKELQKLLSLLVVEDLEDEIADNIGNNEHNPCRRVG